MKVLYACIAICVFVAVCGLYYRTTTSSNNYLVRVHGQLTRTHSGQALTQAAKDDAVEQAIQDEQRITKLMRDGRRVVGIDDKLHRKQTGHVPEQASDDKYDEEKARHDERKLTDLRLDGRGQVVMDDRTLQKKPSAVNSTTDGQLPGTKLHADDSRRGKEQSLRSEPSAGDVQIAGRKMTLGTQSQSAQQQQKNNNIILRTETQNTQPDEKQNTQLTEKHNVQPEEKHNIQPEEKHNIQPEEKHNIQPEEKHNIQPEEKHNKPTEEKPNKQPGTDSNAEKQQLTPPGTNNSTTPTFQSLLLKYADSSSKVIYLASVDSAYLPMALNLYETSFQRLGIPNYLFACSDDASARVLDERGLHSAHYMSDAASGQRALYGSKEFKRKTHLKTKLILDALLLGLTVIIVDVDIIFFKDPLPYLDCADCDIQIQSDVVEGNSGFYMARPTQSSIQLHEQAWATAQSSGGEAISNQKVIDRAMERMQKQGEIKVKTLDSTLFPSGFVYYEQSQRMFYWDHPPHVEVILHNNWIVSMEAKRYRFKELQLWMVDEDGYYSDPSRKYMTYENPTDFGDADTQRMETDALISALIIAHVLNRTLILPTFTCRHCKYGACMVASKKCAFNTHYKIATFDAVWGEMQYREHVFLAHPKVPEDVKDQAHASPLYYIRNREADTTGKPSNVYEVRTPAPLNKGPTPEEIRRWFSHMPHSILRFHSLYNILSELRSDDVFKKAKSALNENTDYRQY